MTENPSPPVGGPRRVRMALSDEEARLIEDFRHRTAVGRAFDEGLETAIAVLRHFEAETHQNPILFEKVFQTLEKQKKHATRR